MAVFIDLESFLLPQDRETIEKDYGLNFDKGRNDKKKEKLACFIDYFFIESTTKRCGSSPYESRNLITGEVISVAQSQDDVHTKRTSKLDSGCLVPTEARQLFERLVQNSLSNTTSLIQHLAYRLGFSDLGVIVIS